MEAARGKIKSSALYLPRSSTEEWALKSSEYNRLSAPLELDELTHRKDLARRRSKMKTWDMPTFISQHEEEKLGRGEAERIKCF